MSTDERVAQLESAFSTMMQLVRNQEERLDQHMDWINQLGSRTAEMAKHMEELAAAQTNSEVKIAALVDAQIQTEEALARLAEAQRHTEQTAAQTNARLDRLAESVERLISDRQNGKG